MRKIKNIHLKDAPKIYQCFGCSPYNEYGMHLEFWEDEDEVVSFWKPKSILQSYPNVLHGGIQSTLLDEIAGWVVYVKCGTVGVTAEMKVRFKCPLLIDQGDITIRAKLIDQNKRMATIESKLLNASGKVCAEAELRFFLYQKPKPAKNTTIPALRLFSITNE